MDRLGTAPCAKGLGQMAPLPTLAGLGTSRHSVDAQEISGEWGGSAGSWSKVPQLSRGCDFRTSYLSDLRSQQLPSIG